MGVFVEVLKQFGSDVSLSYRNANKMSSISVFKFVCTIYYKSNQVITVACSTSSFSYGHKLLNNVHLVK